MNVKNLMWLSRTKRKTVLNPILKCSEIKLKLHFCQDIFKCDYGRQAFNHEK